MSLFLSCCAQDLETNENQEENKENLNKSGGKERILRLNHQENFPENIKYFKITGEKNIYKEDSPHDIYNLNSQDKIIDFSNLCMFCGSKNCNSEKFEKEKDCAIKGLISNLFYDCIFTSQRPNTALIKKYDLVKNFKINNIKLIINCEIHGEHPKCGPIKGLESDSGYTYSPSCFIEEDIDYLNCGFQEDDCPPTLDFMLDIVKKVSYVIKYKSGKVFVHGHSADGRSCLVVACFAIFYFNKTAEESIKEIRKKRNNSINNKIQEEFCEKFEIYVKMLKNIFPRRPISIDKFIKSQNDIIIGLNNVNKSFIISSFFRNNSYEEDEIYNIINVNYIPKIFIKCLDKIISLKNKLNIQNEELYKLLNEQNIFSQNEYNQIILIKKEINKNLWDLFDKNENILIFIELFFGWINENVICCINPEKIDKLNKASLNSSLKLDEILKGNQQINSTELIEFIIIIKKIFSKAEYEIIKYISIFISLIYPQSKNENDFNNQEIIEFKKFLYKLDLNLLGYNFYNIKESSSLNELKEYIVAKNLILIIDFFIFYSYDKNTSIKKENKKNDWIADYLSLKQNFEKNFSSNEDEHLLFFKFKPKINLESIKSFL